MSKKISVLTASIRSEGLDMVKKCLDKQNFSYDDFEWIIVGNQSVYDFVQDKYKESDYQIKNVLERPKGKDDFYALTKAYNDLYKNASGELAVMWVDMTWAPNDVLSSFWKHYEVDSKACVGGIGHQYSPDLVEYGKPQLLVWKDPRARLDQGSFYEVSPVDFEMCLASLPVEGVRAVGGFDEAYDLGAAVCEKEVGLRLDKLGYKFYLDQSIEYRAIQHGRIKGNEEWDKHYAISCNLLKQHIHDIQNGTRIKLDFL